VLEFGGHAAIEDADAAEKSGSTTFRHKDHRL